MILSDQLKSGGYVLLNGLSGAIELISRDLHMILNEMIQNGNPHMLYIEEDDLPPEVMNLFLKRGHITKLNHKEERGQLEKVAEVLHEAARSRPGIVIVPDLDCNYRCVYCFEKPLQARLKGRKTKIDLADVEVVYKSIEQLSTVIGPVLKSITLFGGEPLLSTNNKVIQYIIDKGLEKGFYFKAITNGHDLNAFLPLLGKDKIANIQITVDGPKCIHDKRRISLDNCSSFDRIFENIRHALNQTDVHISIRVNLDESNYRAFGELLTVFSRENMLNNDRVFINVAIVSLKREDGSIFFSQDINMVRAELSALASAYSNVEFGCQQSNQADIVVASLIDGKPFTLRSSYCGASSGMYIFLPDGRISCCWDTVGSKYIGSYDEKGLRIDQKKADREFGRSAAKIPACADCKYCLVCAGGCPQFAEYNSGDIHHPYCDNFSQTYSWVLAGAVEKYLKANNL